ncbi:hypothetical protein D3C85_1500110 [compost metagenome]
MAHGCQKGAFCSVRFIGAFLGRSKIFEQLSPLADVDPAANDAFHLTARIAVRQNPVINRQLAIADLQGAVANQRRPFTYDALIVSLIFLSLERIAHGALNNAFADDVFVFCTEDFQVTVVAALQQSLPITHVDGMRRAIDQ